MPLHAMGRPWPGAALAPELALRDAAVAPSRTVHAVATVTAHDHVVAAVAVKGVGPGATGHRVLPWPAAVEDAAVVVAARTVGHVVAAAAGDGVVARVSAEQVTARAADQPVVAEASAELIVAGAPESGEPLGAGEEVGVPVILVGGEREPVVTGKS